MIEYIDQYEVSTKLYGMKLILYLHIQTSLKLMLYYVELCFES